MFSRGILVSSFCDCKEKTGNENCLIEKAINAALEMEDTFKNGKRDVNSNVNSVNGKTIKSPTLDVRKEEVLAIKNRFPTKIPVIVQRFARENNLPQLEKTKFLVPQELTLSQFLMIIKNRIKIKPTQALYLLVNNRSLVSLQTTFTEVYAEHAGPDGFLYLTYASQETFGNSRDVPGSQGTL